jgi:hypothetical protein
VREPYSAGICAAAAIPLAQLGSLPREMHVPLAHQSALAGVQLAAAWARALAEPEPATRVMRIDLMSEIGSVLTQPAQRDGSDRCLCSDPDFATRWEEKWQRRG